MKLPSLQTQVGTFGLVALDEAYVLAELIGLPLSEPANEQLFRELLTELVSTHSQHATGMVMDPVFTLPLLNKKEEKAGVLVRLEQLQTPDPLVVPKFTPNWSIEDIRNIYGVAKMELYYHPAEKEALRKKQLITEIADYCRYEGIDFLLKIMIYNPAKGQLGAVEFQEAQLQAVNELQKFASALALQYPRDPLAAATLTSSLDVPWLVVSDDEKYDAFKEELRICLENGAKGFLVSESLWSEIGAMRLGDQSPDLPAIKKFIQTISQDRIIELMRIIEEERA